MAEPSRRTSRLSIVGAMLAASAVGALGFALGRSTAEPAPPAAPTPPPRPGPSATPGQLLPAVQARLGRAELITAAASAADAFAAGRPLPDSLAALVGRDFELRLPFACPGAPQLGAGALTARYDEAAEALRVRAEPVRWPPDEWLPRSGAAPEAAPVPESIEGFWISRPWTSAEGCPSALSASGGSPEQTFPSEQTLGIAQIFTETGSRIGRRDGKAYEAVESAAPGTLDLSRGLQLRLRGKLARAPGGGPFLCRAPSGARPVCLLSVVLDEVAVEIPSTGAIIATWDVSSQPRGEGDL